MIFMELLVEKGMSFYSGHNITKGQATDNGKKECPTLFPDTHCSVVCTCVCVCVCVCVSECGCVWMGGDTWGEWGRLSASKKYVLLSSNPQILIT